MSAFLAASSAKPDCSDSRARKVVATHDRQVLCA
jgi:hypothetical protein